MRLPFVFAYAKSCVSRDAANIIKIVHVMQYYSQFCSKIDCGYSLEPLHKCIKGAMGTLLTDIMRSVHDCPQWK